MASEAITRNDLTAILNEVLPPTPSEYKKLLWQNPSITSQFSAQTISLDLADYDEIEIVFVHNINADGSNTRTLYTRTEVGKNGEADFTRTDTFLTQRREYNTTLTGISFGDCVLGSNATVYNNHTIPYKIYGIKYERVAPPQVELPTYSTTEQIVGTWIDGKPIYRKVITGTSTAGTTNIDVASLSIDFPISARITIHNTSNSTWVFDSYIQDASTDSFNLYMSANCQVIYLRSATSYAFGQYWLTLEYTKITD